MRKEKTLTLMEDGKELRFHLQQMSAFDFECWLACLANLLRHIGHDIPPGVEARFVAEAFLSKGFVTQAAIGRGAGMASRLLDEMLQCATYVDDQGQHIPLTPEVVECIIDQATTLMNLRAEILALNMDWTCVDIEDTPSLAPLELPQEARYLRACALSRPARPDVGLCETLAMSGLTNQCELKTWYSYLDALELERILRLKNYLTWLDAENARPVWS